ncbi:MAG TPA: carboxypeptidase-like regulatory domain-containing protein [Puia sp.]|nr:carboxypeptidase-like regulatory domain-containing protein [Puia sp.]
MDAPKKLLFFLLLLPACLYAKAGIGKVEGVLNGYVTDAVTKKPLSGVVVCAMIPGTKLLQEVVTDADGYFRFIELPAAQVTVEFNKKGYQSFKRPNVTIKEKTSVKLNVEFTPDDDDLNSASEYPVLRLLQAN